MNTVLKDYSTISKIELEKRISYYEHIEFHNDATTLFIPDVVPYVAKIYDCIRWATQYRQVVEDICHQIESQRKATGTLYQSIGYRIGSLTVDGRAYAQKNIRHWCQSIVTTNDCLRQILNITFGLGFRPWENFSSYDVLEGLQKKKIQNVHKLYKKYGSLIRRYQEFDNFDKHNLSLRGYEKMDIDSFEHVKYYLKTTDIEYAVTDFLTDAFEHKVRIALTELLDNIFSFASTNNNPSRYYVQYFYDPEDGFNFSQYISNCPISHHILPVVVKTKTQADGRVVVNSTIMYPSSRLPKTIYLAGIHQEHAEGLDHQYLSQLSINLIDIEYADGTKAKYQCKNSIDQAAAYFHFKQFAVPSTS